MVARASSDASNRSSRSRKTRLQRHFQTVDRHLELGVLGEFAGDDLVAVHNRAGLAGGGQAQGLGAGADHQVAADQRMRLAGGDADRRDVLGVVGNPAVDMHRAALLGEAGHFHQPGALAVDLRRLRQHRADGHNAGAADAGDHHVMGAADLRQHRLGQMRQVHVGGCFLADLGAFDGHEGRAEAVEAGESPCCRTTGRWRACAPVRCPWGTMETQFDCTPQSPQPSQTSVLMNTRWSGSGNWPLLAAAALLGGAGLDVDDGGDAFDLFELALDLHHLGAFVHPHAGREQGGSPRPLSRHRPRPWS